MTETVDRDEKRRRFRRRLSYGIAVAITLVLVGVVYQGTRILPGRVARYVNHHYLANGPFEFSIDGISGTYLRRIVLKNPVLRYHSATASYNVFRADELAVTYELLPVFAFRLVVDDLLLRNVAIHLRQDEQGRLVLPVPQAEEPGKPRKPGVSPVVNVRHFAIDGLEMTFGGHDRELAVNDVSLEGALTYEKGIGNVTIDQGRAYLVNSKKTISEIHLAARTDGTTLFLQEFGIHLDESFVMASGEFRQGRLHDVKLTFDPISLGELHELGLTPELEGRFSGQLAVTGPVDSLHVAGDISGEGLGVELSGAEFDGVFTPRVLDLARMRGKVFGSFVDGKFRVEIKSGDFRFDGECRDLDLSRGFIKDSKVPPMALTGHVSVDHNKAADRYAWRGDLTHAVVDGYESFGVHGEGVWEKATGLTIERASLDRPGYRVSGTGHVPPSGDAEILFNVDGTDLSYFWNHFKLPPVGGAVSMAGRLQGPLDNFQVNLSGAVRDARFEMFEVDSAQVQAEVRHVGTPAPSVTLSLAGRRGAVSGEWFDSPRVLLEIDTTLVRVQSASFVRGDTTFSLDLDVAARGKRSHIDVRRVSIKTPQEEWISARPSTVLIDNGRVFADSLVLVSGRGEIGAKGTYIEQGREIDAVAWGRGMKLELLHDALRLPVRLEGAGDFDLHLQGDARDPRVDLSLDVARGVIDSVAFDRLTARASFDGAAYHVVDLLVVTGSDSLQASGEWKCAVSPVRLAKGETKGIGDAPLSAEVRFARYPLATVFAAMHRPSPVASAYSGALSLGGTANRPRLRALGDVVAAPGPGREIPPAHLDAEYADGSLRVTDLSLTDGARVHASGSFPVVISLLAGPRIETEQRMTFKVDVVPVPDRLAELGRYVHGVSLLRGVLSGSVEGSGTPAQPRLVGSLSLARGELRLVGLQERFHDVALRADFVDDVVRLASLTARSGDKGTLSGMGWARVSNYRLVDYRVDVNLHEFWLRSIPDVEVRQDGKLSLRMTKWRDGRRIPSITGALEIREANITMDLGQKSGGSKPELTMPTDAPDWIASIDLNAPKNVWIRNPDVTVEMSAEDMILTRDEMGLYFRGDLTILRGSYKIYGNKFQITSGSMNFSAAETTLRPEILIEAYTPHHTQYGPDQNIYLTFSWPHDEKEPKISLSYDEPGYSEADIWKMLGGSMATGIATNTLERVINAQMTSGVTVDVTQRKPESGPATGQLDTETLIGVGKYLWEDNIYLQYRRGLSVGGEQEVNLEYRLSNKFLLRSQFIYNSQRNRSGIVGKNTDEYNLDLKYRFEY